MYDPMLTYEQNYVAGPQARVQKSGHLPHIRYLDAPRFEFLGVPLHLPLGIPAGPLLNASYVNAALNAGFCLPVYKTVRALEWPSHPKPNVLEIESQWPSLVQQLQPQKVVGREIDSLQVPFRAPLSISNSFGVPSQNPEIWKQDFAKCTPQVGSQVVLSFQGTRRKEANTFDAFVEDTCGAALWAAQSARNLNQKFLEVNLSCPNEKGEPIFKNIPKALALLNALKQTLSQFSELKLIAKIGVLNDAETLAFVRGGVGIVDAIAAINTVPATIISPSGEIALGSGDSVGGVCGALIFEEGMQMMRRLVAARRASGLSSREISLIAVGGVMGVREFALYTAVGADLVQAATGAMWNLLLAQEIARSAGLHFEEVVNEK